LERHIPDARFVKPQGGYFLWVDLPEGSDVAALASAAAERGVVFIKGPDFLLEGGDSSLRIAYSAVPPDQIEEGIARVADAYRELAGAAAGRSCRPGGSAKSESCSATRSRSSDVTRRSSSCSPRPS